MKKIVFLPIETEARELDAKLVLASKIVNKEVTCLVGQHNTLNTLVDLFEDGGTYIGKNIFLDAMKSTDEIYKSYKRNKFSILWYHEEGGIYSGNEEKWKIVLQELLDPRRLSSDDHMLCWGRFQKDFFDSFQTSTPSTVVGGYRFDLRQESTLRKLLKKTSRVNQKNYILVNTAFSDGNHHIPRQVLYKENQENFRGDTDYKFRLLDEYSEDVKKMGYFCEMLSHVMRSNPDKTFVLRPHPTEAMEFYENAFHEFDNIIISKDFSAVEWILGCSLLIQNGCTTSVEAFFLQKPVISYYPFSSSQGVDVTRGIGVLCKTPEEVNAQIINKTFDEEISLNKEELLSVVSNFASNDSTIDLMAEVALSNLESKEKNDIPLTKIKYTLCRQFIINCLKFYPRFLFQDKMKAYEMAISHFPGFNKKEIDKKISFLNEINSTDINLNFINKDLFILSSEK
jgi:surface carbohydrate biosynthesis protein|tara:strand:+ start:2101 stop:3465 length:1365 start_codon:yes stop_codon:yes gene_type:complete